MQSKIIALIPILLILVSMCAAKDIPAMLSEANKLKYAEKYEEAEKIYDEVLKIEPENKEALTKLDKTYKDNNWSNPYQPLTLSAKVSPEVTKEMDVFELTVSIKNKSRSPVILLDFQFEGLRYITFYWQKAMYGELGYDKKEGVYCYNSLAQQETYHYFNNGLLLPGQTAVFRKTARIPKPTSNAYVRFVVLNEESMRHVYLPSGEDIDTYVPISYEELKAAVGPDYFTEEEPFPNQGTIIFDAQDPKVTTQSFILVLGEK